MPDLPELYEALDKELTNFLHLHNLLSLKVQYAEIVSALCAAIEVKQTQEFHEYLNRDEPSEWERIIASALEAQRVEKEETTTETQEEA